MPVDYTFLEVQKAFTPENITAATGLAVNGVLPSPQQAQIITVPNQLDEKELDQLKTYMADFGFVLNQPLQGVVSTPGW